MSVESNRCRNDFGFALLRSMIGLKNSRHLLNQSEAKPKLGHTRFPALGAGSVFRVLATSSYWLVLSFAFVVIGHCNCFGFSFATLN